VRKKLMKEREQLHKDVKNAGSDKDREAAPGDTETDIRS